jgi:hypothetical protein
MLSVNEFILNKIETAALNNDESSYTMSEINDMITTSIEDYEYEFNTTVNNLSDIPFKEVKAMLNRMNITIQ